MDSITEILRKLKAGEEVDICDIYASVAMDGKQGAEQRLAALIAWVTNAAGSDSADAILADIRQILEDLSPHGRFLVEPLGRPDVRKVVAAGATSALVALSPSCRRASIVAIGADIRFQVGSNNSTTASSTTHLILQNERLDIHLPTTPHIAAIRNAGTSGTLEITELIN
jgi:hypothetical protein